MGGYGGAQADLLRVPFADANCLRLPGEPGDEWEDDFVVLADAFRTGYHAAVPAGSRSAQRRRVRRRRTPERQPGGVVVADDRGGLGLARDDQVTQARRDGY